MEVTYLTSSSEVFRTVVELRLYVTGQKIVAFARTCRKGKQRQK